MPFKDLLLYVDSYPDPTPPPVIAEAVALASRLGGRVSVCALRVLFPLDRGGYGERLLGLADLARAEEQRSLENARTAIDAVAAACPDGLFGESHIEAAMLHTGGERLAVRARTHDLCILPAVAGDDDVLDRAQAVIFGSGRPVILMRPGTVRPAASLGRVVVAWDAGRCAARALADAIPLLTAVDEVRVVTVRGEKVLAADAAAAVRHLRTHGVLARHDDIACERGGIGPTLEAYVAAQDPDLVVMGAWGHSRLREFVLGGATAHMLRYAQRPVFFSH